MAVQAMWIKNNMLGGADHCERQLTELELKVQRSLQKLSIPDWYLNKRSIPPKILRNTAPIESRPPPWKNEALKESERDQLSASQNLTGTYKVVRKTSKERPIIVSEYDTPKSSPGRHKKLSNPLPSIDETFDLNIPKVKLSSNISKTFPKVSPSRKIQNINIVFPPPPKRKDCPPAKGSFVRKITVPEGSGYSTVIVKRCSGDEKNDSSSWKISAKENFMDNEPPFLSTPNAKADFNIRATSTPGRKPMPLPDIEDTPNSRRRLKTEKYETPNNANTISKPIDTVHSSMDSTYVILCNQPPTSMEHPSYSDQPSQSFSPSTRFFISRKKSTELENIVKSKQKSFGGKGIVRKIVEELNQKCNSESNSESKIARQPRPVLNTTQNFVKKLVRALENGSAETSQILAQRRNSNEEDSGSSSECEVKSSSTSISLKDTDSECDQRSPSAKSDETFDFVTVQGRNVETKQEDDSVYWIPIPQCKLPRSSSLLSMMSKLSTDPSPCMSPIKNENQVPQSWEFWTNATGRSSFSKGLFRIDETAIIDSGYSDKSERSGANSSGSSTADSMWYEENQNDSGTGLRSFRFNRSSPRRKSIISQQSFIV